MVFIILQGSPLSVYVVAIHIQAQLPDHKIGFRAVVNGYVDEEGGLKV